MNKDLTQGKPIETLRKFCLPLFASVIFQQLYNVSDSLIAGKFINEEALAAVGNSYEITLIFLAFAFGLNIGASVIVSQLFGAKRYKDLKSSIYTSFITSLVLCLILMLFGFVFLDHILKLINTPDNILLDTKVYLKVYIYSLPFVFFYNIVAAIFSALGDSKTPFIFLAASSLTNILANIFFVTVLKIGVMGLALATLICQGISCILALLTLHNRLKALKTDGRIKIFSLVWLNKLSVVTIPSILQQSFISVGNIIIQGVINSFGSSVIAGFSCSLKLNSLAVTALATIGNGLSSYTAQNVGAKKYNRVKEGFIASIKLVSIVAIPISFIYFFYGKNLSYMFLDNPQGKAIEVANEFLKIVAPFYLVIAIKFAADGILRGSRQMTFFMIATFSDLILRVILAKYLSISLETKGIALAWPIGWTIACILSITFFLKGKLKSIDE